MPHRHNLNPLNYNYVTPGQPLPDPTVFRCQASSIANFFSSTSAWYNEKLLGGKSSFDSSTGSVLGTVVHYLAEQRIKHGGAKQADVATAMEYVQLNASDVVDPTIIEANYLPMYHAIKSHLLSNPVALAEPLVTSLLLPGICVGGSIDAIRIISGDFIDNGSDQVKPDGTNFTDISELSGMTVELVDWKTTSALNPPTTMTKGYEWQLLVYAYVLKHEYNITVAHISDIFITRHNVGRVSETTGKPLKDYPSTIGVVSKPVTQESFDFIESIVKLVAHSVESFTLNPSLRYLLAQDMRLVDNTQPLPFTSIGTTTELDI